MTTWRLDDWQCADCGAVHEEMTDKTGPRETSHECPVCKCITWHARLMSAPAKYMRDKTRAHNIRIHGGKYDTEGYQQGPHVPDLPGADAHDRKTADALAALPDNASKADIRAAMLDTGRGAPSLADYHDHMSKPEIRELKAEHAAINRSNAQKRARGQAINEGKTTVGKTPLPGDAKELHR